MESSIALCNSSFLHFSTSATVYSIQNSGFNELCAKAYSTCPSFLLSESVKKLGENPFLDSYVMEFLDLPNEFHENDLRKALIRNMKDFILELGKDFTFIDEEYRHMI